MKFKLFLLPSLLLMFLVDISAQDWRSFTPLKTTRSEVELLLGPATTQYFAIYQLKEGRLFVEYSSGPCRPDRKGGWNVAENVVVRISFSPKDKQRLSDAKLDRKKFKRTVDQHINIISYYVSEDDGILYEIQRGNVVSVEYGPPKKYRHLQCN